MSTLNDSRHEFQKAMEQMILALASAFGVPVEITRPRRARLWSQCKITGIEHADIWRNAADVESNKVACQAYCHDYDWWIEYEE